MHGLASSRLQKTMMICYCRIPNTSPFGGLDGRCVRSWFSFHSLRIKMMMTKTISHVIIILSFKGWRISRLVWWGYPSQPFQAIPPLESWSGEAGWHQSHRDERKILGSQILTAFLLVDLDDHYEPFFNRGESWITHKIPFCWWLWSIWLTGSLFWSLLTIQNANCINSGLLNWENRKECAKWFSDIPRK